MTDPHPAASDDAGADGPTGTDAPILFTCPACGHAVAAAAVPERGLLACPACGAEFFATAEPTDEDRAAAEHLEVEHRRREQELNDLRIKQFVTERQATFRTRSYYVVGLCAAVVVAIQLGWRAVRGFGQLGLDLRPTVYLSGAAAFLVVGWLFLYKVRELDAELAKPVVEEPTTPPDLSTLLDGSQRVADAAANLERLSGRE